MRKATLILAAAFSLSAFPTFVNADTLLDILGAEKTINDAARTTRETGDHIAQTFYEKISKAIAEWKAANADSINLASDRLDAQSKNFFREVNGIAVRLQNGEAVTFIDMQRTMATAGGVMAKFPGASEPEVTFSWPSIVLPTGEPMMTIRVVGANLANANPTVTRDSQTFVVRKASDNEISYEVERASLPAKEHESVKARFQLSFWVSHSHWWNPFSWWSGEQRTRDIELSMLPTVPGMIDVARRVEVAHWETKVLGPILVGGAGKDAPYRTGYSLTPLQREQQWIVDKVAQQIATDRKEINDNGGDGDGGSSCSGYDPSTFTDTFVGFNIQHGHDTDWAGHKSDAHQNCNIWVHVKRLIQDQEDDQIKDIPLSWQEDVDVEMPQNIVSYKVKFWLYTGLKYTIQNDQQIPYSSFEIMRSKDLIKFRPRPVRDF